MNEVIVLGAIGKTERQNRDAYRVIGGGGVMPTLLAHIDKDKPLVCKRYQKCNISESDKPQKTAIS